MSSQSEKKFTIRLSDYGPEILADSLVRNILLATLNEVLEGSVTKTFKLYKEDSRLVPTKEMVKSWMKYAKTIHVDSLSTEETKDDETIDDLFGEFSELVLLEVLKTLFTKWGLEVVLIEEILSEKHEEFADIEDLVRVLANTSPALAATAALLFGVVDFETLDKFAISRADVKTDSSKTVFPPLADVIGAYIHRLDEIVANMSDPALAAGGMQDMARLLSGIDQDLLVIDNETEREAVLPRDNATSNRNTLEVLWYYMDEKQKARIRKAADRYGRGSSTSAAFKSLEEGFEEISQGG